VSLSPVSERLVVSDPADKSHHRPRGLFSDVSVELQQGHQPVEGHWEERNQGFGVWCLVFGVWCLVFGFTFGFPGFRRKPGSTLGYYPPTLRGENTDRMQSRMADTFQSINTKH
jgi:hypothetical protein